MLQVPEAAADAADAGSVSLFHGDSVSLQLKTLSAVGKSSTADFMFNDNIEEKTEKLQLVVCTSRCVDDCSHVFVQLCL